MTKNQVELHTHALLQGLHREFDGDCGADAIEGIGHRHLARLVTGARILDYIPVLVYRATRNDLVGLQSEHRLHDAA
jgi:Protein of unknown function (DUF3562)